MGTSNQAGRDAFLVIKHGEQTRVRDVPTGKRTLIGSAEDADITLSDPQVAPRHIALTALADRFRLEPLAPGVYVAGKPCEDAVILGPGEELRVGSSLMVLGKVVLFEANGRRALTHHELRERLYEELARANRGGRPTALVMLAARSVGEGADLIAAALDSFRAGDVVATFAPDEPEFLLPDMDEATARQVVERIVDAAEVSAHVGLAVAPQHGESPERLLRAAREALAASKQSGQPLATPPPRVPRALETTLVDVHDEVSKALLDEVEKAAASEERLLLMGERSSGKSAFARLLHIQSRREGRFVTVACAALEGEAADTVFNTRISEAAGGTLLLDEVGELDDTSQASLLNHLDVLASADVRLVVTTHRALAGIVERGGFRRELYEKIAGRVLEVPALRNRPDDILPLAQRFAREQQNGAMASPGASGADRPVRLSPGAIARLCSYPWPGNVLELRNAMGRAVRLARDGEILAEHLPSEPVTIASGEGRLREHVDSVERDAITKALADCNHNQTHAAKRLGISRRALIYKMEKYGLKRPPKGARR